MRRRKILFSTFACIFSIQISACNRPELESQFEIKAEFSNLGETLSAKIFDVEVSGEDLIAYRIKFGEQLLTNCTDQLGYSNEITISTSFALDLTQALGKKLTLCAVGKHRRGIWQRFQNASRKSIEVVLNGDVSIVALEMVPSGAVLPIDTSIDVSVFGITDVGLAIELSSLVVLSSEDSSIVEAVAEGLGAKLRTKAPGSTTINAEYSGLNASATFTVAEANLVRLVLSPSFVIVPVGFKRAVQVDGIYSDGRTVNATSLVEWGTSNKDIASVEKSGAAIGTVAGKKAGEADVFASLFGVEDQGKITVTNAALEAITVVPDGSVFSSGTSVQLTAVGSFSDKSQVDLTSLVTWISNNSAIASVTSVGANVGLVRGNSQGRATISATLGDVSSSTNVTVTTATFDSISLVPENSSIVESLTQNMIATGSLSDGSTQDLTSVVTWNSSEASIAIVSNLSGQKGKVTGVGAGSTQITASFGSLKSSTALTVKAATLTRISVAPSSATVLPAETQQYTATAEYSDGSVANVTESSVWESSDESVGVVSDNAGSKGQAQGLAIGTTEITATFQGKQDSADLIVGL